MRHLLRHALTLLLTLTASLALRGGPGPAPGDMKASTRRRLFASCYEVVALKPEKDPLTYERELPWDLVPYNIRTDKYVSIGTAFAISRTELVTAQHVLNPLFDSLGYRRLFIRDVRQNVYEVDRVLASDEHRDVIRFTVKGRTFNDWIEPQTATRANEAVYTLGNAYGEGLVLRRGDLLGTMPEPFSGAWDLIKSSADVNPGNSGGPLVDAEGRLLGVVLSRKDNLCYSLPVAELLAMKKDSAVFYNKVSYGFLLLPGTSKPEDRAFQIKTPLPFYELRDRAAEMTRTLYAEGMDRYLGTFHSEFFPAGESSLKSLHWTPTSVDPEVIFKDADTGTWTWSGLDYENADLGKNARLRHAKAGNLSLIRLTRPDDVPLWDLIDSPRRAMDLLLRGARITRTVGGQEIRVTSFGDPLEHRSVVDAQGRPWDMAMWLLPHSDEVAIAFIAPNPRGVVMVLKFVDSDSRAEWTYDMKRLLGFVYLPYVAKLKEWRTFLSRPDRLPPALRQVKLDYVQGKALGLETPWATLNLQPRGQEVDGDALLGLYTGFEDGDRTGRWSVRRIVLDGDRDNNYFVLLRHPKPDPRLPDEEQKHWKEILEQRHPYTGKPFSEDGNTCVATLLGAPASGSAARLYTLYLVREGSVEAQDMRNRLGALVSEIRLHDPEASMAAAPQDPGLLRGSR